MSHAEPMGEPPRSIPVASADPEQPRSAGPPAQAPARGPGGTTPRPPWIDIHEGPAGLILVADLPGVSERTLTVHLEHNVLRLQAAIEVTAPANARLIQQEYPMTGFERSFILSDDVDRARITAELDNGVLRIQLPRLERVRTRRIEVRAESPGG
jgi:HSP20 family protein